MYDHPEYVNSETGALTVGTKQESKQKILAAAREIISEQGGASLNMKELAQMVDVPRAAVYRTYAREGAHHKCANVGMGNVSGNQPTSRVSQR